MEISNAICSECHQQVLPEYYFCPNCGKNLREKPLPTSFGAQLWLYIFSLVIMPITYCLAWRYWKGWKYFKSPDPKAKRIGLVAIVLLAISIIFLVWSTYAGIVWLQQYEQNQTNSDLNSLGL